MNRLASGRASRTALLTTFARARHFRHDPRPLVLEDPWAEQFLPLAARMLLANPWWTTVLADWGLGALRMLEGEVLVRSRVVEDELRARLRTGLTQCVVLGAGFDTCAVRLATPGCRFFEVDHPATQRAKSAWLQGLGGLRGPTCVPVDFTRDDPADALRGAGFDPGRPALVSWLGVVMYLPPASSYATLAALRPVLAPGSCVFLDLLPAPATVEDAERGLLERASAFTAAQGEPMHGLLDPEEVQARALALGFSKVTMIDGSTLRERYFAAQPLRIHPPRSMRMVRLDVAG